MARLPRLTVPGWPHLLQQRGHNQQPVFRDDADRTLYLDLMRGAATAEGVAIHAYALRDNEVRLLATPARSEGLSRMMQAIGRRYGSAFNRRHGHTGGLWEGRFRATVIEPDRFFLACTKYVESGVKTDVADEAALRWSSANHHLGVRTDQLISDHLAYWALGNTPFDREAAYRRQLQEALTSQEMEAIQSALMKGWPLGSASFVAELSTLTTRRLAPLPRGRPVRN